MNKILLTVVVVLVGVECFSPCQRLEFSRRARGRMDQRRHIQRIPGRQSTMIQMMNLPSEILAFGDQGNNLAGNLFQYSLLPYLGFLYFLGYEKNKTPELVSFGFTYLLLFVAATIPTGILAKNIYGVSLADADWLHGGAESLLTVSNVLIVLGFRSGLQGEERDKENTVLAVKAIAGVILFAVIYFISTGITSLDAHSPFLQGLGNIPQANEPENALSIPTWIVHFSSVSEFVVAIALANQYGLVNNPKWRGFALGMLPSHASGVCACVYHFFYNNPNLKFLVTAQAGLTFIGNLSLCFVAYRLAASNGYTFPWQQEAPPSDPNALVPKKNNPAPAAAADTNSAFIFAEIAAFSLVSAYATKYGSLSFLETLQDPSPIVATALVLGIPAAVAFLALKEETELLPSSSTNE